MKNINFTWRCNNNECESFTFAFKGNVCPVCQTTIKYNGEEVWDVMPNYQPNGFPISRCKHLNQLEKNHFWFKPRARLLKLLFNSITNQTKSKVLEFGCGSGNFLNTIDHKHTVVGVDGHMEFLKIAKLKSPHVEYLHCDIANIPITDNQFDVILAFDVLEHVDSKKMLDEAYRLVKPGGHILISVPAFQFLWSRVDEQAGHRYRYSLKTIKKELMGSGWKYNRHTYYQFLLFPFVYLSRKLHIKKSPKLEHKPPSVINKIFYYLNSIEISLFANKRLPYGSSLITIASKPK